MIGRARPAMESDPHNLKRPYCEHTPPFSLRRPCRVRRQNADLVRLNSQDHRYWCRSPYRRVEVGVEEHAIGWVGDFRSSCWGHERPEAA